MPNTISQSLLPEFDHEMANTRKMLARVPADRSGWAPHAKSMTMGRLAGHLALNPVWATRALAQDEFDWTPDADRAEVTTTEELLAVFDRTMGEARGHVAMADDAAFMQMWTFKKDGHVVMSMPRMAVIRSFVMNHMIHHRGQLSVYLRLCDVPVPGLYGPSADEM